MPKYSMTPRSQNRLGVGGRTLGVSGSSWSGVKRVPNPVFLPVQVDASPAGESFLTITDANGVEQFLTVTDSNGVEQRLTVSTG